MSLAAETREAVRARPFLLEGLRAGVVNYAAAARALAVSDDTEAVATALRRFRESLPARDPTARECRVTMRGGIEPSEDGDLLTVGGTSFRDGNGPLTAVLATGDVDGAALRHVLGVLAADDVVVTAAGVGDSSLVVIVDRPDGPASLRQVEAALEAVPSKSTV